MQLRQRRSTITRYRSHGYPYRAHPTGCLAEARCTALMAGSRPSSLLSGFSADRRSRVAAGPPVSGTPVGDTSPPSEARGAALGAAPLQEISYVLGAPKRSPGSCLPPGQARPPSPVRRSLPRDTADPSSTSYSRTTGPSVACCRRPVKLRPVWPHGSRPFRPATHVTSPARYRPPTPGPSAAWPRPAATGCGRCSRVACRRGR